MRFVKSLGLLALASLTALFIGVGSASAVELTPDLNSTWTGVDVTDCPSVNDPNNPGPPSDVDDACEFEAVTKSLPLTTTTTYSGGGLPVIANCKVTLTILIWDDGSTKVREVVVEDALEGPTPIFACSTITTSVDPEDDETWWSNQICEDEDSNPSQYWDRVEVNFSSPAGNVSGPVFALLNRNPITSEARGAFLAGELDPFINPTDRYLEGEFNFNPKPAFKVDSNEDPCNWPELDV